MKRIHVLFAVIISSLTAVILPTTAYAKTAASSAALITPAELQQTVDDKRAQLLQSFLEAHNSPLAPFAVTFVAEADKNNLDWRLVAAISGLESSFGIHIPANSYNGWGFGIYGNNVKRFVSWEEGISVVSQSLRQDYMNKWGATNIAQIGSIYAASPTWAYRVQYFMDEIDQFAASQPTSLTLSL